MYDKSGILSSTKLRRLTLRKLLFRILLFFLLEAIMLGLLFFVSPPWGWALHGTNTLCPLPLRSAPHYTDSEQAANGRVYSYENNAEQPSVIQRVRLTEQKDGSIRVDFNQHSSAFFFDSAFAALAFTSVIFSERSLHLPLLIAVSVLLSLLCALICPIKVSGENTIISRRIFRFILFGGGILLNLLWAMRFFI